MYRNSVSSRKKDQNVEAQIRSPGGFTHLMPEDVTAPLGVEVGFGLENEA